jgi:hydroxymethylglutaryl-CoA synthase
VVAADIAEYERGSTGEQTQGAGAVAMLVERTPKLAAFDLARAGQASDYRGPDFRKPFARHFSDAYAVNCQRLNDFPVFSGKYSTFAYLDETACAVDDFLGKGGHEDLNYFENVCGLFFHRPYQMMPVQAMSFLYARALTRSDERAAELAQLCAEAQLSVEQLRQEAASTPDLFASVQAPDGPSDPFAATSALAAKLRKSDSFREFLSLKMGLGSEQVKDLGNLYCAALPAWIAAGLEDAALRRVDLAGKPLLALGYGSGDAAEAIPFHAVAGFEPAAQRIRFAAALEGAIDLTQEQYQALHDGDPGFSLQYAPSHEFFISRVGDRYDPGFQDLGVEYYDYAR